MRPGNSPRIGQAILSAADWLVVALILACVTVARPAGAQPATEAGSENVFQWADRGLLRRLDAAKELLAQGRYGEAARYLGAIAEAPEDYFVQSAANEPYRSLKAEAHRLIGQLPPKGRESYELQYGARARRMLQEAVETGNPTGLAEVSRRFFHTQAGYEATFLLGLDNLERGSPLTGALTLRRLREVGPAADRFEPTLSLAMASCWRQAGVPELVRKALVELKSARSSQPVMIAGREVRLFDDAEDPVQWFRRVVGPLSQASVDRAGDGWLMFRGNPSRNSASPGGAPLLNTRWRVPITNDPLIENDLQQLRQRYRDEGVSEAPVLQPLAVGNVVLMRTVRNLLAVDFDSGKRLWEVPVDDRLEAQLDASTNDWVAQQSVQLPVGLAQRIWDDAGYGTLSSDGQSVYSVEDLGIAVGMYLGRTVFIRGRRVRDPGEPKPYNRLTAHDIRTGKLKWHLGGASDQFSLRMPETFFLGPPLPLAGRLYVLAESKEEIRLCALRAESGDLLWSQQLAVVEQPIQRDVVRRLAGATPSYADGVLVCPTSSGAVVAVELATRSLLWGYRYAREVDPNAHFNDPVMRRLGMVRGGEPTDGWSDSSVTVVEGRVLVSPVESNEVHCVNLLDGRLLWKRPRQDDLYLACVDQGKVVLVGRRQVRALRLADGEEAWAKKLVLPEGSVPSGRGYLNGTTYYVPLGSAEVLAVDVTQGRAVRTIKSREGMVPGNLICHRGRVISQSVEGVESFYQLDALRALVDKRLARQPDDAEALALRGEILSDEGKRDAAIEALRRANHLSADVRTRELLREAFLEGLREEFGAHCRDAGEIERLLDDPQQEATYQRLMAAGFQQSGKWDDALTRYGKLMDLDVDSARLETISRSLIVRRDRWVQMQLEAMRKAMPAATVGRIEEFVAARWKKARQENSPESLKRFLQYFGTQPQAAEARTLLVDRLIEDHRLLEAELLLYSELEGAEKKQALAATSRLAGLLREAKRTRDAAVLYSRLAGPLADVAGADKRSGRQLVEALPKDDAVRRAMASAPAWPRGKVEIRRSSAVRQHMMTYGKFVVKYRDGEGPFLEGTSIQFDQNRAAILCQDGLGNVRWQVSLADSRQRPIAGNPQAASAKVRGHLMVLSLDGRVVALDTLTATPRVLWSEDLTERVAASRSARARVQMAGRFGFNAFQQVVSPPNTMPLGPVNERFVCFQRFRDCVAVDPADGRTLWIRRDVPSGSELFGDERYVFIVPPNQAEAMVLNGTDGSLADRRPVPATESWLATIGRDILLSRREHGLVIERYDPWQRRTVWKSRAFSFDARVSGAGSDPFAQGARMSIGPDELVTVVEPGRAGLLRTEGEGHFTLLAVADGRVLVDAKIAAEPTLSDCFLFPAHDRYLLIISRQPEPGAPPVPTQPMPGMAYKPIASGLVYCFDRQGKSVWPAPAKIENQHILPAQPADLPLLIFACQSYQRGRNDGGQFSTSLLGIDKRSGRVVARETYPGSTGTFELVGDADKMTIEVRLQQSTIRLRFTDQPYTAEDDAKAKAAAAEQRPARSLLEAIWKAATEGPKKGK